MTDDILSKTALEIRNAAISMGMTNPNSNIIGVFYQVTSDLLPSNVNGGGEYLRFIGTYYGDDNKLKTVVANYAGLTLGAGLSPIPGIGGSGGAFGFTGDPEDLAGWSMGGQLSSGITSGASISTNGEILYFAGGDASIGSSVSGGYTFRVVADGQVIYHFGAVERFDYTFTGDQYKAAMHSLLNSPLGKVEIQYEHPDGYIITQTLQRTSDGVTINMFQSITDLDGNSVPGSVKLQYLVEPNKVWRFKFTNDEVREINSYVECFLAGTPIDMWDGTQKPIEEVSADDRVASYDGAGNLVPGRVTRTFRNRAKYILDVHGLMVTPGHVTLCGEGVYKDRHVPMIDILRSDGAFVKRDGSLIRASTGQPVGSVEDRVVWAIVGDRMDDGTVKIRDRKQIRLGARHIMDDGRHVSVLDLVSAAGCTVSDDGWVVEKGSGERLPFHWPFTANLPNPEDYILQRSQLHLHEIYQADEWEAIRPQMPMPEYGEAGPVISRDPEVVNASPPNIPLSLQKSGYTPAMNRKQRRAYDARRRRATKQAPGVH